MKTRTGKIARLPEPIREQLNQRLFNGVLGKKIISWLSTLPEVNRIMVEQFAGIPISENNLSEWRRGGYQDWLRKKKLRRKSFNGLRNSSAWNPKTAFGKSKS